MTTLQRNIAPEIKDFRKPALTEAQHAKLNNGIETYVIAGGEADIVRIEWIFHSGKWHQHKPAVSGLTASMLREGVTGMNSAKLAETIDRYGATISTSSSMDHTMITLVCLSRYVASLLPLVQKMILEPEFPSTELETTVKNSVQALKVKNEKIDYRARKIFNQALFGQGHPYGHYISGQDYEAITSSDLAQFHKANYNSKNCTIFISGKVTSEIETWVADHFGEQEWGEGPASNGQTYTNDPDGQKIHSIAHHDSVQSALRIGHATINKLHKDFLGLTVVNTALGGYFSSRLMSNIRQEKGLTYGIYSRLSSMKETGVFYISAEVNHDNRKQALSEIYKEIERLKDEPVSMEELSLVRNYILGGMLSTIDGPFKTMDTLKGLILYNLGIDYFYNYLEEVKAMTPARIQELAKEYLSREEMYEVVVG